MKKHLFGFALFSLIVGTAVFAAALARSAATPPAKYTFEVSKRSCRTNFRQSQVVLQNADYGQSSVKIVQAVLNEKTRQLNTDFFIKRETPSTQSVRVKLTFVNGTYQGKGSWNGVVRTEYVILSPDFNIDNNGTQSVISSYQWLDELKSSENLYVTAEVIYGSQNNSETVPRKADFRNFTPVLLMNKDRNF